MHARTTEHYASAWLSPGHDLHLELEAVLHRRGLKKKKAFDHAPAGSEHDHEIIRPWKHAPFFKKLLIWGAMMNCSSDEAYTM